MYIYWQYMYINEMSTFNKLLIINLLRNTLENVNESIWPVCSSSLTRCTKSYKDYTSPEPMRNKEKRQMVLMSSEWLVGWECVLPAIGHTEAHMGPPQKKMEKALNPQNRSTFFLFDRSSPVTFVKSWPVSFVEMDETKRVSPATPDHRTDQRRGASCSWFTVHRSPFYIYAETLSAALYSLCRFGFLRIRIGNSCVES